MLAVLAPTVGPIVGGWITQTYSWHWLFLINVLPGIAAAGLAAMLLPRDAPNFAEASRLDVVSLALLAIALAALEITLKEAPQRGWTSGLILGTAALSLASAVGFARRTLRARDPIVDLRHFADRNFAIGCVLSFGLGIGLFGSVYLMPVFLAFVRGHNALQIGEIMLVTGLAQLAVAPLAVALERRCDARLLTRPGSPCLRSGSASARSRRHRPTRRACSGRRWCGDWRSCSACSRRRAGARRAGARPRARCQRPVQPDAQPRRRHRSGLIDTVIFSRAPVHGTAIVERLQAGDTETARFIGLPLELFAARPAGPIDAEAAAFLRPLIEKAAMTSAINEAWALVALLTLAAMARSRRSRAGRPRRSGAARDRARPHPATPALRARRR